MVRSNNCLMSDDIILQRILPLLPIKNLTQCKLLSKHYYSSLCSPNFILKYTKQPLFPHPGPPVETLFIQSGKKFYLYSCKNNDNVPEYHDGCYFDESNFVRLDVEFSLDYGYIRSELKLIGSSNGLVCIAELFGKCFILYNPFTNQSRKYYPGDSNLIERSQPLVNWGFGYVSSLDDFKVVRIMMTCNQIHVFSLKTNTWRLIGSNIFVGPTWYARECKLVGETLYWNLPYNARTIAFDLVSEEFELFPHIIPSPWIWGPQMKYFVGGCLCMMGGCISKCEPGQQDGVVIIDIYTRVGRREQITFGCGMRIDIEDDFVGFSKTGKVFVAHFKHARLGLIDRNSKRVIAEFENEGLVDDKYTYIQSYVATDVSPHPSPSHHGPSSSTQGTWAAYREDLFHVSREIIQID